MAEQIISPGVFTNEDIPTITEAAAAPVGAVVVGPTPLGPMEIPSLCTSFPVRSPSLLGWRSGL